MVTGTGAVLQRTPDDNNATKAMDPEPKRTSSEHRRSNKPIMEKRRRARINNCLNELKSLILDAMKKDPARHSKLEKADILEMTVKHLENLQRQQKAMSAVTDPSVVSKFRAGFSECAGEVGRFPGLDTAAKRRLLQHLAGCLAGANLIKPDSTTQQPSTTTQQPQQVHILPSPSQNPAEAGIIFSNGSGVRVHLVPQRLPNGDIALVLPTGTTQHQSQNPATGGVEQSSSPLPMLVPIPTRTASTGSASSTVSSTTCYSSPASPQSRETQCLSPPIMQKPLSLVVRKNVQIEEDDSQPWRPW